MWWPKEDEACYAAIQEEMPYLPKMISQCSEYNTAVQAGGNIGVFPLFFANHFKDVFSFEPDKTNFECLSLNTEAVRNIQIFNMGLGEKHKTSGMNRKKDNCGAHFMEGTGEVIVVPLDDFELETCDLLQLDIEGYEYLALKGAKNTIKRCKPVIICEEKGLGRFHGIESNLISCFLLELGYKINDKLGNDVLYTCQ